MLGVSGTTVRLDAQQFIVRRFYGMQEKYTDFFWHQRGSAVRSLHRQPGFTMYIDVLFAGAGLVISLRRCWQLTSKSSQAVRWEPFHAVGAMEVEASGFEKWCA